MLAVETIVSFVIRSYHMIVVFGIVGNIMYNCNVRGCRLPRISWRPNLETRIAALLARGGLF